MLVVDADQKAISGHPGAPMLAAPTTYTLWQRILRHDPAGPSWINRDRTSWASNRRRPSWSPRVVTARVTVEEGSPLGSERAEPAGIALRMPTFGTSAPMKVVVEHFGFAADPVATAAKRALGHTPNL
jgi:transketolase